MTFCTVARCQASKSARFDPTDYVYDTARLDKLKQTAAYIGQKPCPGGQETCDVWAVNTKAESISMYVNITNNRIMKVSYSGELVNSDTTHKYENEHITEPTNYTNAPAGSQ